MCRLAAVVFALCGVTVTADDLAVVGATLFDGTGAPPVGDAVLVVAGDRVRAAGPRSAVSIPKGVRIVDGRGRWLVPGLIDAHVHFFQSGGPYTRPDVIDLRGHRSYEREVALIKERLPLTFARYLLSGITTAVDVGGPFWNFDVRDRADRTPLAPRVFVAGPLVSTVDRPQLDLGDPPMIKVTDASGARELVRREAARRPDLMKVWFIYRPGDDLAAGKAIVAATVDEARAHGLRVAVHATQLETARAAVEAGASVLVHSVTDVSVDEAFVKLLLERGVLYIPTLFVGQGYDLVLSGNWMATAAEKRLGEPDAIAGFEAVKAFPEFKPRSPRADAGRVAAANLKRLSAAGVAIAAGTDAGNIGTLHGPSLFRELRLMVEAGMSSAAVLVAATRNGAAVAGRPKDLGTLEPGRMADFLLLRGDPLADLANLEDPVTIVKAGRVLDLAALRRTAGLPSP
jgi:imidazolonepropionase-like amidohydrolase